MNIQQYLINKTAQLNCNASLNEKGELIINYAGRDFTPLEFDLLYPVNVLSVNWQNKENKGLNNNKKIGFIHNIKSY